MTAVIGMTWKELLRKKVLLMTVLMTVLFLIVFWFIARTIGASEMMNSSPSAQLVEQFAQGAALLTLGFFFGSFILAFLVIFSSFSAISGEAETGIMQSMLTRPIPRWKWYLGRWLGYALFGILYALILYISIVVIADIHANVPKDIWVHIQSYLLFALTVPVLVTLSLLGSTSFSAIGNGVFMTMLYGAGWLGGMVEKVTSSMQMDPEVLKTLYNITGLISLIMPVDAIQRKMLALLLGLQDLAGMLDMSGSITAGFGLGQIPSASFIVYAVIYTLILLAWGTRRFYKKDF
ncbi:ABC transporter permease [Paenibacillus wulumuqiensis]|uniref:ABC transporter permease n=1 Tax=Paenibacillus wulumuqiensis TaxID=1567107 RepID=UPI0006192D8A|nr:ABC transporter permease subunit [Paenibacillus wulumuqiensis]